MGAANAFTSCTQSVNDDPDPGLPASLKRADIGRVTMHCFAKRERYCSTWYLQWLHGKKVGIEAIGSLHVNTANPQLKLNDQRSVLTYGRTRRYVSESLTILFCNLLVG